MSSITSRQLEHTRRTRAVTTKATGDRLISRRYRKALERVVLSYLITFTAQKLSDDVFFENLFDKVYLKLPPTVKTILGRKRYLRYIILIKAILLERLYAYPDSRSSPAKK
ncbi:Uncharacterised protein [Yersinia intermedia]|uniref:hypothetical protein n=1 Tax=Yersinia intermedia TaxID=631 RepID=UPI0005E38C16|nr:hypothetical protein [Yersinia intermedia]MDA5514185.1 hypothetical protein [Yersinia intermedia]CQD81017.1 Uncharacterised protein [Yersinia intermedia]